MLETEIQQRYKSYCREIIDNPIDSDYEPISYEEYKAYIIKKSEPVKCPKCNRTLIQLHRQYICYNEYCSYRIDKCK